MKEKEENIYRRKISFFQWKRKMKKEKEENIRRRKIFSWWRRRTAEKEKEENIAEGKYLFSRGRGVCFFSPKLGFFLKPNIRDLSFL